MKKSLTNRDIEAVKQRALDIYRETANLDIESELLSTACIVLATLQYAKKWGLGEFELQKKKFYQSVDED